MPAYGQLRKKSCPRVKAAARFSLPWPLEAGKVEEKPCDLVLAHSADLKDRT